MIFLDDKSHFPLTVIVRDVFLKSTLRRQFYSLETFREVRVDWMKRKMGRRVEKSDEKEK